MIQILSEILRRSEAGEKLAVCTLVHTRGSCPQRPGAVMLVLENGQTIGTIGGGCVEAEVKTRAMVQLGESRSRLLTFQLDHDLGWDDGLICGGVMDVAVEVIDSFAAAAPFQLVHEKLTRGDSCQIVTTVPDEKGQTSSFQRQIDPTAKLLIAGAGHVGQSLARVAQLMEFEVTVIDDRADLLNEKRFPGMRLKLGEIDEMLGSEPADANTFIVIVTRGHKHDGSALAAVIAKPARYIGLIGSRRKVLAIFDELRQAGVSKELQAKVHAPIGLDIGAVTPAEIAVSIAAELVAVRRGSKIGAEHSMQIDTKHIDRLFDDSRQP
jgi:xanthine dehydrogenase accessory factor